VSAHLTVLVEFAVPTVVVELVVPISVRHSHNRKQHVMTYWVLVVAKVLALELCVEMMVVVLVVEVVLLPTLVNWAVVFVLPTALARAVAVTVVVELVVVVPIQLLHLLLVSTTLVVVHQLHLVSVAQMGVVATVAPAQLLKLVPTISVLLLLPIVCPPAPM